MTGVSRAVERGETAGFMKIIIDAETDRILGASILATEGGEVVQILGAMMLADAPYTILKGAVFIHPTLVEGLFRITGNREASVSLACNADSAARPRQGAHVVGQIPEVLVGFHLAESRHAGKTNTVLHDPEKLPVGVFEY